MKFTGKFRRRTPSPPQSRLRGGRNRLDAATAFTLVEIMVALAIFSILVAAIYSTWTVIIRAKQVGTTAAAQIQRERITVRTIEDSLTCVQSFQASLPYYSFVVQNGDQPKLSFVARVPAVFPRNGRFGDFNLRRMSFTLEPGPDSEKDLVLRQNPILMDVDSDEQSFPLVLARNVQDFVVECWDTNEVKWVDTWDNTNAIPSILRVSLAIGGSDARNPDSTLAITRVITLPSMMLPGILQSQRGVAGGGPGIPGHGGSSINGSHSNPGGAGGPGH